MRGGPQFVLGLALVLGTTGGAAAATLGVSLNGETVAEAGIPVDGVEASQEVRTAGQEVSIGALNGLGPGGILPRPGSPAENLPPASPSEGRPDVEPPHSPPGPAAAVGASSPPSPQRGTLQSVGTRSIDAVHHAQCSVREHLLPFGCVAEVMVNPGGFTHAAPLHSGAPADLQGPGRLAPVSPDGVTWLGVQDGFALVVVDPARGGLSDRPMTISENRAWEYVRDDWSRAADLAPSVDAGATFDRPRPVRTAVGAIGAALAVADLGSALRGQASDLAPAPRVSMVIAISPVNVGVRIVGNPVPEPGDEPPSSRREAVPGPAPELPEAAPGAGGDRSGLAAANAGGTMELAGPASPEVAVASRRAGGSPEANAWQEFLSVIAAMVLLAGPGWLLYHRIHREKILEQPERQRIHDLVLASPGIRIADLPGKTALHYSTCAYHVRMLARFGLLATQKVGRHIHCFETHAAFTPRQMTAVALGRGATARVLLGVVEREPGIHPAEIARRMGLSRPTVKYHVDRLAAEGLLAVALDGRGHRLHATNSREPRTIPSDLPAQG